VGGIVQDAKTNSLNKVVSKFLTDRGTYDHYLPLKTIFACFIFLRLLSQKFPDYFRRSILDDWQKIQLKDPDSLLIIEGQLKSLPSVLKGFSEKTFYGATQHWNSSFFFRQAVSETGRIVGEIDWIDEKSKGISLKALTSLVKWVMDQPVETWDQWASLLEKFDEFVNPLSAEAGRINTGGYTTPKTIARLMAAIAQNQSGGMRVYDPCFGSGYLLTAYCELEREHGSQPFGNEIDGEKFIIGFTRLLLLGEDPFLNHEDALKPTGQYDKLRDQSPKWQQVNHDDHYQFDVVLANPPWASRYEGYEELEDLFPIHTADTAGLFLQHALSKLLDEGLAVLVLPEGFFYKNSDRALRKELVNNHDVKAIISLPANSIHDTSIKPHILVVSKGGSTQKIRMINSENYFERNKSNLSFELSEKNLSRLLKDITGKETVSAWDIGIDEIIEREWDLTPKARNILLPMLVESLKCEKFLLKDCCEILTGNHIESDDLIDRPTSKKKVSPLNVTDSKNNIGESQHVLSVSAAETNHLIEKYLIHSCPNKYSYEVTDFITFRLPPHGAMETIYKIEKISNISEKMKIAVAHDNYLSSGKTLLEVTGDEVDLDQNEIERLSQYLKGNPFKKNDRFYFLSKFKKLPKKFTPVEYNNEPAYPTIGEMLGNKLPTNLVDENKREDILYIRIKDIQQNQFISQSKYLTPEASASINKKWKLNSGDVLLSKTGTIGKTLLVQKDIVSSGALASPNFFILRAKRNLLMPEYLQAYILGDITQMWLRDNARGHTLSKLALEKLQIPLPDIEEQLKVAFDIEEDKWNVLVRDFKTTDSAVLAWDYIGHWIEVSKIQLEKGVKDDLVQFDYLSGFILSANEAKDEFLKKLNMNEEKSEGWSALKDWFINLVDILNGLVGISDIPRGAILTSVLSNTISQIESLIQNCLVYEGGAGYVGNCWEWDDKKYDDAHNFSEHLIFILKRIMEHVCKDVKLNFEPKENTIPRDECVELKVVVSNRGSMPVINLAVHCKVDLERQPGQEGPLNYLDWGRATSSCLPEKEKTFLNFSGHPPRKAEKFSLTLFWKALSLDGSVIEGSQQIPLRIVDVPIKDTSDLGGNPYIVGPPVGRRELEHVFFGREDLIDSIRRQVIKNGNVILLEGNRRAGKSSILEYLKGSNRIPGWLCVYCSLQGAEGAKDKFGVPTEEIFRMMALEISKGVFEIGIECPLPNNTTLVPDKKLKIADACREGIGKEAPFADFREYLETILEVLQQNNLRLLLMIDEYDKLQEGIDNGVTSPQVPENIRFLIHQYPRFSTILTGSRAIKRLRKEYWNALFGFGTKESVTALKYDDAVKLIKEPSKDQLVFANDAVEKLCSLTARQPFLIQHLCSRIFDLADRENNSSITLDVINRAASLSIENNDHFPTLWGYAGSDRRRFLLALSQKESKNPGSLRLGIIHQMLLSYNIDVRDEQLSKDLENLQDLELIKLVSKGQDARYELAVPLMGDWIDSHQDFEVLKIRAINDMED
jgi:type I restriction-modification system DNA methylase subunit